MKNVALLWLLLSLYSCLGKNSKPELPKNKYLPSFNLFLADSSTYFNTNNIPIGKPIVLFFFGPRCPYSQAQMQDIVENMTSLQDIQFYILTTAPFIEMKSFYKHYQLNKFKNIKAGVDYTNFFPNYFTAENVPYTVIYSKEKRLMHILIGKLSAKQIRYNTRN